VTLRPAFVALSGVAVLAGVIVSYQLYQSAIVPRLPAVRSVPLWWWLAAGAPIAAAALTVGWCARSGRELVGAALAGACGWALYAQWARFTSQPGFRNQSLGDSTALDWSVVLLLFALALLPVLLLGRAARALWTRGR